MTTRDDGLLDTQTAAPPPIPPRRPIVGIAMADHDDLLARLQEQQRQLAAIREQCDAIVAATHANRERLRARMS